MPFDKFVSSLFRFLKVPPNTLHAECLRALLVTKVEGTVLACSSHSLRLSTA